MNPELKHPHGYAWALALLVSLVFAPTVEARRIAVDFDAGDFSTQGSAWVFTNPFDPSALPASGSLEFTVGSFGSSPLSIGSTSFTGYCMFEDGAFSFTQAGASCNDSGNALFNVLPADLQALAALSVSGPGAVFASQGYAANAFSEDDSGATYSESDAVASLRFSWIDMAPSYTNGEPDGPAYSMQAFIYFLGNGDFELDLRYGIEEFGNPNPLFPPVTQSIFANGAALYSNNDPIQAGANYFFRFTGGQMELVDVPGAPNPPTPVPEPGALVLMMAGLASLACISRRTSFSSRRLRVQAAL